MTKRIMALLVAAVFVLSSALLVACGGGNDNKTTEPTKSPAQSKPAQSTTEPAQSTTEPAQSTPTPAVSTPTPVDTPTPPVTPSKPSVDKVAKADDEQGWIKWLANALDNETAEDAGIPVAASGKAYTCTHDGCEEGSWWEIWGNPQHFHACYQFDTTEYDATANIGTDNYAFTWEIYVRLADTDNDFEKATTAPWSVYPWGGDNPYVIYRIPTYDEGIKSMCLAEDGSSQEYEVIFVVFEGDNTTDESKIFFVFQTWTYYTDSTEAYINEAKAAGIIGND